MNLIRKIWNFCKSRYAVLVVLAAFLWAAGTVLTRRQIEVSSDTVVIRIGHWQLEPGMREGINTIGKEYAEQYFRRTGIRVKITQDAIPEGTFATWVTTQLMGGTAPDILQCGMVSHNVMIGYFNRYFYPLTSHIGLPNPYNKGTPLEGVAWRNTYKDAMRSGYIEDVQQYMLVPLSQMGTRILYNKELFSELTGKRKPSQNFQEFIEDCRTIASKKLPNGRNYTPISSSAYHFPTWDNFMATPLTCSLIWLGDYNRDGTLDNAEHLVAYTGGNLDFSMRPYTARLGVLWRLSEFFQQGFTGLGRDEAVFLFIQEQAVFLTAGTWDQAGLREQAKGSFGIGVMKFPIPRADDPEFGDVYLGDLYESAPMGFPFGLTRTCKHPDIAIDFLLYLSSKDGNERLNSYTGWIPIIRDTEIPEDLKEFEPNWRGAFSALTLTIGGETIIRWQQEFALFQVRQATGEQLMQSFGDFYKKRGPAEYEEMVRNIRRSLPTEERKLVGLRMKSLYETDPLECDNIEHQYMGSVGWQIFSRELQHGALRRIQRGEIARPESPYSMTAQAKAQATRTIRTNLGLPPDPPNPEASTGGQLPALATPEITPTPQHGQ